MEKGYGKRTAIDEYPRHNRGGNGVLTARLTDKTGRIAAARVITEKDSDLMIVSASGVVIRMDVSAVRALSRTTQGTLVQHLAEGDSVVAISTTNGKKDDELEGDEDEGEIEGELGEEVVGQAAETKQEAGAEE
jgi:DNA gyrase subunit A